MNTPVIPLRQAGDVCPETGRVAVAVADLADSDLNGDVTAYWFDENADFFGLDPWRMVEGIDPLTDGSGFDLCFANGATHKGRAGELVYLRWTDAQRLAMKGRV